MADPVFTDGVPSWNTNDDNMRVPTASELLNGYPCGPFDLELFNFTTAYAWGQVHNAILEAGITPDLADLTQLSQAISLAGLQHGTTVYNTAGAHTFTAPEAGWYWVDVIGGGGGAANSSGSGEGGGGGGYAGKWVYLEKDSTTAVTVGAAGVTDGSVGVNGTAGGSSSFGAHCSATGGAGGGSAGTFGAGGTGSGGDINLSGQDGTDGLSSSFPLFGRGGDAAGPIGGKSAQSDAGAKWPGGGGSRAGSWNGQPAAGGVVIRY